MMSTLRFLALSLATLALTPTLHAAEEVALDPAPINLHDAVSLQRGAQIFTNYCLSCHSAAAMRFNRLRDIGLSDTQIATNLMFPTNKVGDLMRVGTRPEEAKAWFGAAPPDLSVIARARGADWLYTYLRSFYRDPARPSGWNNAVFDKVAMPHVLWQLQGDQKLVTLDKDTPLPPNATRHWHIVETKIHEGGREETIEKQQALLLTRAGQLTRLVDGKAHTQTSPNSQDPYFDDKMADLTAYLVWMGEPAQLIRQQIGAGVLIFLIFLLLPLTWLLKREYWKNVPH